MSSADLIEFLKSNYGIEQNTLDILYEGSIDGEALLLLDTSLESFCALGLKLGPAIKLRHAVIRIEQGGDSTSQPAIKKRKRRLSSPFLHQILTLSSPHPYRYDARIPGAPREN
jgi:hypothetical protein